MPSLFVFEENTSPFLIQNLEGNRNSWNLSCLSAVTEQKENFMTKQGRQVALTKRNE